MSLDHLHPFSGQHAIESAAFALDFSGELNVGELHALRAAADQLVGDFPVISEKQRTTVNFQVGPEQTSASSPSVEADGFLMARPALVLAERPLRFIDISRTRIVVVVSNYTRWDSFKADVDRYLSVILTPIQTQKAIASLGLQFNDIFLWKADPEELKIDEVFVANNPYVAQNIFSSPSLWHSHHGYLIKCTEPVEYQRLDNVNVSRVSVNEEHQLQILTSHSVTLEKPIYKGWSDNKSILFSIQDDLHGKNKSVLAALLTPAMQEKINLNEPRGV